MKWNVQSHQNKDSSPNAKKRLKTKLSGLCIYYTMIIMINISKVGAPTTHHIKRKLNHN